ncbi:MAG: GHMP kinase [Methylocystis sp.]|nr:GHMP kinase [Methylocystis sp.]
MTPKVSVVAGARLHLGFLDMNGALGRKFGGFGLSLDAPTTRLTLARAEKNLVEGPERARAARLLEKAQDALSPQRRHALTIDEAIPAHAGLGSGTQLALAIAAALRRLEDLPEDLAGDAALLERGARSGLGAGLFRTGGLVVDGGRGPHTLTPPIVARADFPESWRALLVSEPRAAAGLHGESERDAFAALAPLGAAESGELCRLVLMQALPALAETDLAAFGAAVTRVQEIVGDYFAPAQGGRRFASAKVEEAVARLLREGATGGGQTSWGPTGFAFVENESDARRLIDRYARDWRRDGIDLSVHKARNRGAAIDAVFARIA